ncbi:hypothetical protein D3C72_849070 [compost metagenome]
MLGFLEGCLDHWRAVHGHVQLHAGRQQRLQGRQLRLDLVDRFDDVGAGLAVDHQQHRALVIEEAAVVAVLDTVGDGRHVGQAQDGAVLLADHHGLVVLGAFQLVIGTHLPVALGVLDKAHRPALVGVGHGRPHFIQRQAVLVEQLRLDGNAHRRQRTAADLHLPYPRHLGQALRQDGVGQVVQLALLQHVRSQRQHHDRCLRRVDLLVGGHAAHTAGQQVAGGVDRRLHLARRTVDVAAHLEADDHPCGALVGAAGQGGHPGNAAQLALQRRGHGGGHDFRAGAGQVGRHHDHREVHLWQRRHRQQAEADPAQQHDRQAQQHGRHRATDERTGQVHASACFTSVAGRQRRARRSKYR